MNECNHMNNSEVMVRIGLCAMAKKVTSTPMKEILHRMDKFQHIRLIIFDEPMILDQPIESWPICDALVSFYSTGFPLEKAIAYSKLRKPYLVNDLESQYTLMNRRLVYECLKREGVTVPRYACVPREPGDPAVNLIEGDDSIEIDGQVFHKPFVEKPLNAENHNVYIYFPSSAGGGSQHLFRKVGNQSSKYFPQSNIRRDGSYMYEEFMPTDGTDVKVYTVADDYAHAEARKSPALDGKVERDHEGKEVRYPVILTPREKIIAKKVAKAVQQQICGFDLLRANGMSYVCDVNGFSFVKSSKKYYDDCSHILGVLITRRIAPQLCIPANLPPGTDLDTPLVPTTCGTIMELRCVIAVIRHGDRTPKQKLKMEVRHEKFSALFSKYAGDYAEELKLKRPTQLQEVLDIVRHLLDELRTSENADPDLKKNEANFVQLRKVLEMYGCFSGINRKIQLKKQTNNKTKSLRADLTDTSNNNTTQDSENSMLLIVKWGGELTAAGRQQAEKLGKSFRCIYPGGDGNYGKDPGLGLLRLHSTYRHDLQIYASDEGRVQMTAAAFAKGFLALEGELPPILVQMVKSANTNGLLDSDNDCRKYQDQAKKLMKEVMSKTDDFTEEDYQTLVPTGANSLVEAMNHVVNPHLACDRLMSYVKRLCDHLPTQVGCNIHLYQNESWELVQRRWEKLLNEFRSSKGDGYDISKIPDIYDNIKYDLQHNRSILIPEAEEFFMCAKWLADIVVPQEYGIKMENKLRIGRRICTPLMRKILADARYTDVDECTRLHAGHHHPGNPCPDCYSKGVASPERFVRSRLYFTSESHLHSLLTCLRYGRLADVTTDEQWKRAMDYVSSVSEINYLAQIVIMIYEDPTVEPKTEQRFHVELHFSPGAYALCHDEPGGTGFRTRKLERLNSQASVVSSATSVEKCNCDPVSPLHCSHSSNLNMACTDGAMPNESAKSSDSYIQHKRTSWSYEPSPYFASKSTTKSYNDPYTYCNYQHRTERNSAPNDHSQNVNFWRDSPKIQSNICTTETTPPEISEEDGLDLLVHDTIADNPPSTILDHNESSDLIVDSTNQNVNDPDSNPLSPSGLHTASVSGKQGVGIGRFVITRSVIDSHDATPAQGTSMDELGVQESSGLLTKHSVVDTADKHHHSRPANAIVHSIGRSCVSCSPNRCNGTEFHNGLVSGAEKHVSDPCSSLTKVHQKVSFDISVGHSVTNALSTQLISSKDDLLPNAAEHTVRRASIPQVYRTLDTGETMDLTPVPTENDLVLKGGNPKSPSRRTASTVDNFDSIQFSIAPPLRRHSTSDVDTFKLHKDRMNRTPDPAFARLLHLVSRSDLSSTSPVKPPFPNGHKTTDHVPNPTCGIEEPTDQLSPVDTNLNEHLGNKLYETMMVQSGNLGCDPTIQSLNALTYPSRQSPYSLDIERLIRAMARGTPVPRNLISTAVIRGSRDDGQCSSVPDMKRLMEDKHLPPPTLTPDSPKEFLAPTAPSVFEVYSLETLHNALTLSQLEKFLADSVTQQYPTASSSPTHPSSPINTSISLDLRLMANESSTSLTATGLADDVLLNEDV